MAEYRLYAHKNSYAMTTQLLLEELGIDYHVSWFNVHKPEEFSAGSIGSIHRGTLLPRR